MSAHCGRDPAPVGACGGTDETCSCECNTCVDPNAPSPSADRREAWLADVKLPPKAPRRVVVGDRLRITSVFETWDADVLAIDPTKPIFPLRIMKVAKERSVYEWSFGDLKSICHADGAPIEPPPFWYETDNARRNQTPGNHPLSDRAPAVVAHVQQPDVSPGGRSSLDETDPGHVPLATEGSAR